MEKKAGPSPGQDLQMPQEINVTIHHAENGPTLEACMVSILSSHMSKNEDF